MSNLYHPLASTHPAPAIVVVFVTKSTGKANL